MPDPRHQRKALAAGATPVDPPVTSAATHRRGWQLPAIMAVLIVAIQVGFVFCLSYPPLHAAPHDLPIGVAGPASAVQQLSAPLAGQRGVFNVHSYPDANAARAAIENRDIYGAIVVTHSGPALLVASAADARIAQLLRARASRLGGGHTVPVTDVVPGSPKDPAGAGSLTTLLPLVLLSIAMGAVLGVVDKRSWRLLLWCAGASVAAGAAVAGVSSALGIFTGSYWPDAGAFALLVFALSSVSAGLSRVAVLRPLEGLLALVMLFIGIPSAGATVPPELLAQPWRAIGPYLPPAATLDTLRGVTFFDGAAIGAPLAVLAGWSALGLILLGVPWIMHLRSRRVAPGSNRRATT